MFSEIEAKIEAGSERVREIIEKVMDGKLSLYLPAFQRDFVWDEDDVKDFFDSILKGYPVGSIILWQHADYDIEKDDFAEPLVSGVETKRGAEKYYILDGQQRLTAIMLLYCGWRVKRKSRSIELEVPIAFRPSDCKLIKSKKIGIDLSELVRSYVDGEIRRITSNYPSFESLLKDVARRILEYEIPIYYLKTYGDLNKAVMETAQAFIRINKEGVRIGGVELQVSLLTGYIGGKFSRLMREKYVQLSNTFSLDLVPFLRFVLSNIGFKQTDISKVAREKPQTFMRRVRERLGSQHPSSEKLNEVFDTSFTAMELALKLISQEVGVKKASLLPSQLTLIPIATYLCHKGIRESKSVDPEDLEKILAWLIIANFRGRYTSNTDSKLQKDINIVKNATSFPFEDLLSEFRSSPEITLNDLSRGNNINVLRKSGQPYMFILYITLVKEEADDWTGALIKSRNPDELAKHHIFPKEYLEESGITPDDPRDKETFMSGLGNITFIDKHVNSEIGSKAPEEYLNDYITSAEKHFIPIETSLWKLENYESFKEERVKRIYNAAKKWFPLAFK